MGMCAFSPSKVRTLSRTTADILAALGNTTLFQVAEVVKPPKDISADLFSEDVSRTFHHIRAQHLRFKTPNTTIFVPIDSAWKSLDLVESYLTMPSSRCIFASLLQRHIRKGRYFRKDLNNSDNFIESDVITSTGVAHTIPTVLLPPFLNITSLDLIEASKQKLWMTLIPQNQTDIYTRPNLTFLIPSDDAIRDHNMTSIINNMQTALALHIAQIPNRTISSDGSLLHADIESETLHGNILQTRKAGDNIYNLKLKGTKHSARVLNHGRTTDGSEVLIIDTIFKPTWVFPTLPNPNAGLVVPWIALIIVPILIFILGGLMGFFFLTLRRRQQKQNQDSTTRPLLVEDEANGGYGSVEQSVPED